MAHALLYILDIMAYALLHILEIFWYMLETYFSTCLAHGLMHILDVWYMLEASLVHTFGTWFVAYLGCFGTCLRHVLAHGLLHILDMFWHMLKAYLGTWFA
jgi:hypothetical protein